MSSKNESREAQAHGQVNAHVMQLETRNRAFHGAFCKGWEAASSGKPESVNPYDWHDTCRGGPTFARAFHRYWQRGYDAWMQNQAV